MVPGRNGDVELDYIGPDLDIGFRLSKASRPGRVVLSMDLADVLTRDNTFPNPLELHHVGWEILKGVFGDKPYPIIWAKKNGEEPHILPWEDHLCPLTESFLKEENKKDVRALRVLITSVRTELPQLELFPPYFTSEEMPQSHQEYWKGWKDSFVRDRNQDAMNQGEDLA